MVVLLASTLLLRSYPYLWYMVVLLMQQMVAETENQNIFLSLMLWALIIHTLRGL